MKRILRIVATVVLLLIDMLVFNRAISILLNKFFDIIFIVSPLIIIFIYIKPFIIMSICNRAFADSDNTYRKKNLNTWISLVAFILICVIYSRKLIADADFAFFEVCIYIIVSVFSAVALSVSNRNTGDGSFVLTKSKS